ncbi:MAG: G-D-S-L family lipolytic protein, partial [Sphingobium sp.]|nr:G-D-S-L family lipolytic protein [Sphingobium sp.]
MGIAAKIVATLAALLAPLPALATRPGDTILIAGDSTASTYKGDRYPQTGWG